VAHAGIGQLRVARTDGVPPAHLDADHAARHLYAVVEGLRWPTLIGAYPPARRWPSLTTTSRHCSVSPEI
jgi:hypothetical protein